MKLIHLDGFDAALVDELDFSLVELSRVCRVEPEGLIALVEEGVLAPLGADPQAWRFAGECVSRARTAVRIGHDLELNAAGVAVVLDLLDQLAALRARLRQHGCE